MYFQPLSALFPMFWQPSGSGLLFPKYVYVPLLFQTLMERRVRPWINKKIIEYIGEEEPTLVEFVCSKVSLHGLTDIQQKMTII